MRQLLLLITFTLIYLNIVYCQDGHLVDFAGGNICQNIEHILVFSEDFNGTSLDESKWTRFYPYGNNGSDQCSFCRTHSSDDKQEGQIYKDENVRVENGSLFLDVKKENASWYQFDKKYTSGMIHSKQTFNTYSKYEIRCKIPAGTGYWPAFWMFGWNTELDVFEFYEDNDRYESSVHFWDNEYEQWHQWVEANQDLSSDMHTYAIEYDPFLIHFYLDGNIVATMPRYFNLAGNGVLGCEVQKGVYIEHPEYPQYGNPLNVIANVALLNQQAENELVLEGTMEIDYIKVYQRIDPCEIFEDFVRVEENDTWTTDRNIRILRVEEEVTLNLDNCTIKFPENGRVYLDE